MQTFSILSHILHCMTESLTEFLLVKIFFVFLTLLKCNFCKAQSLPKSFSCFTSETFHQQLCVLACRNCLYSKCSVSCQCGYWSSGNQRARTCYWYIITCLLSRCKNHLHSELDCIAQRIASVELKCKPLQSYGHLVSPLCKWWWGSITEIGNHQWYQRKWRFLDCHTHIYIRNIVFSTL